MNDWYIAAYEPIRDFGGRIVGMLYVGTLEAPYLEMKRSLDLPVPGDHAGRRRP